MSAAAQLYPLSTEDGKSIPLEVIRPLGAFVLSVADEATFTTGAYPVVSIRCTKDAVLVFDSSVVISEGVDIADALILPAETIITAAIPVSTPSKIKLMEEGPATLYVQYIQKWAGLGLTRQVVQR